MLKRVWIKSLSNFSLLSFALLISAALIFGAWSTPAQAAKKVDAKNSVAGLVDINNATQKELVAVKGIGVPTAKKIIANRPYTSTDELTTKAGLDAKAVAAIKPLLTVGAAQTSSVKSSVATKASEVDVTKTVSKTKSAAKSTASKLAPGTKININTADKATLETIPEIGSSKAQSIIDGRPYKSIEDIKKIKGIKQKTFDAIKEYLAV